MLENCVVAFLVEKAGRSINPAIVTVPKLVPIMDSE